MSNDNLMDLLITKFFSADKDSQKKLLKFLLSASDNKDHLIDVLNKKKLSNPDKNYTEGDFIMLPVNVSSYPSIDKKYYEDNKLIINDLYIRVQIKYINPMNNYVGLELHTNNLKKEVVDVYHGHMINQNELVVDLF